MENIYMLNSYEDMQSYELLVPVPDEPGLGPK